MNEIQARRASEGIQILEPRNDYSTVKHCTSLAGAAGLYGMRNFKTYTSGFEKRRDRGRWDVIRTIQELLGHSDIATTMI